MASEILRPNSNINTLWGGYQYTSINEDVTAPSTSVDGNFATTTKSDSDEEQSWGMDNTTLSGDIDSIVLWFYARSSNGNSFDMNMRLEVGSGNYTDYVTQTMNSSTYQWFSIEYNPSGADWTTAQVNDLRINFLSDSIMSNSVVFNLQAAYVEVTEASGSDTYNETGSGGSVSSGVSEVYLINSTIDGIGGSVSSGVSEVSLINSTIDGTGGSVSSGASVVQSTYNKISEGGGVCSGLAIEGISGESVGIIKSIEYYKASSLKIKSGRREKIEPNGSFHLIEKYGSGKMNPLHKL